MLDKVRVLVLGRINFDDLLMSARGWPTSKFTHWWINVLEYDKITETIGKGLLLLLFV